MGADCIPDGLDRAGLRTSARAIAAARAGECQPILRRGSWLGDRAAEPRRGLNRRSQWAGAAGRVRSAHNRPLETERGNE